jgi:hypothetical protein
MRDTTAEHSLNKMSQVSILARASHPKSPNDTWVTKLKVNIHVTLRLDVQHVSACFRVPWPAPWKDVMAVAQ